MNQLEKALEIVATPIQVGAEKGISLMDLLKEAVRGIIKEAPNRGLVEAAPDVEGLGHLVRVLVAADKHSDQQCHVVGFLRIELMELESLMKKHPGDPASACRRLGFVLARALELMGQADAETYSVPKTFRLNPQPVS